MNPQAKEVTVTLPIEAINAALVALSKFPYDQAQPHIELIKARVDAVLKAEEESIKAAEAKKAAEEAAKKEALQ